MLPAGPGIVLSMLSACSTAGGGERIRALLDDGLEAGRRRVGGGGVHLARYC